MKKKITNIQTQNRYSKKTILFLFCLVTLLFLVTACYTNHKCPAYGYYSQVIMNNE